MKIINSTLRAIVERVTQIEWDGNHLYVFEHLDRKGVPATIWIQNWECEDITNNLTFEERKAIYSALEDYYKSESNSSA